MMLRYTSCVEICTLPYFYQNMLLLEERSCSVGIVTGWRAGRWRNRGSILGSGNRVFFQASRLVLRSIQPSIVWIPGALSPGHSGRSVKLITHLHLVPRLRMRGVKLLLFPYPFIVSTERLTNTFRPAYLRINNLTYRD
jgi:hypothetical protein